MLPFPLFKFAKALKAMSSLGLEFDISCISSHEILYFLHHDLNFHRFSRNWVCELSCDTFQSSQSYVYLQLVVIGLTKVHTSSQICTFLWPILATHNFLYTITSKTEALTISLGPWKTHSQKNNTPLSQIIENLSHTNL
jgi:hypothetical protein